MSRPWMPLYVGNYLADTAGLNAEEHGAYLLLIMHYWAHGPLPDDDARLARIAACTSARWRAVRRTIERFFKIAHGKWKHKRIEVEIERAERMIEAKRRAGKARHAKKIPAGAEHMHQHKGQHNTQHNALPSQSPLHKKEESKNLSGVMKGALRARKAKSVDFSRSENRQAYARQKMQRFVDPLILMAAEDPLATNHVEAVRLARAAAAKAEVMWSPPNGTPLKART